MQKEHLPGETIITRIPLGEYVQLFAIFIVIFSGNFLSFCFSRFSVYRSAVLANPDVPEESAFCYFISTSLCTDLRFFIFSSLIWTMGHHYWRFDEGLGSILSCFGNIRFGILHDVRGSKSAIPESNTGRYKTWKKTTVDIKVQASICRR